MMDCFAKKKKKLEKKKEIKYKKKFKIPTKKNSILLVSVVQNKIN